MFFGASSCLNTLYRNLKPCIFVNKIVQKSLNETGLCLHSLVMAGYKQPLTESSLWQPDISDKASVNAALLEEAWQNELKRCHWYVSLVDTSCVYQYHYLYVILDRY